MNSTVYGNFAGISALVLWSVLIGLIRSVTEAFGVQAATPLIYTIGAAATFIKSGVPDIRRIPRKYLFGAGIFFVVYEVVFSQSIGMAQNAEQTMEIGMLNYLWPCLTVVLSIWINKVKLNWLLWPGLCVTLAGLFICVSAVGGLSLHSLAGNIVHRPIPYILGFAAAVLWALYSNMSIRYSKGFNAIGIYFAVIAAILWCRFLISGGELHYPGFRPACELVLIGMIIGFSYVLWENGIHRGNFMFLAVCSYFSPAASMFFAAVWLHTLPPAVYWAGVALVVCGSLLCWASGHKTARKMRHATA